MTDIHLPSRRVFLDAALRGLGALMVGCAPERRPWPDDAPGASGAGTRGSAPSGGAVSPSGAGGGPAYSEFFSSLGELGEPNDFGLRLPPGYTARILAEAGKPVPGGAGYVWHALPDGGATFPLRDGGHVYVSNSEVAGGGGGVGAIEFSPEGTVRRAYPICAGTSRNCQGGTTPRRTFLTCEEVAGGLVYECDPHGRRAAVVRPLLGAFMHEAVAYDQTEHVLYLSEDELDGRFYRFVPERVLGGVLADLSAGRLEVASMTLSGEVSWHLVPDPQCTGGTPTRYQVSASTAFAGGEGVWWHAGKVYLATKGDDRVWQYDVASQRMSVFYDVRTARNPILSGVDALLGATSGEILVAEDGGDMQVVVIAPNGDLRPLLQLDGQPSSEITGIALSPGGGRLYFSSQRGGGQGITYEVMGPLPSSG